MNVPVALSVAPPCYPSKLALATPPQGSRNPVIA